MTTSPRPRSIAEAHAACGGALRTLPVALVASVALGGLACGPSKTAQCESLIGKANVPHEEIARLKPEPKPTELESTAASLDKHRETIQSLALADARLVEFRTELCASLAETARIFRESASLKTAVEGQEPDKVREAGAKHRALQQSMDALTKRDEDLANRINEYCEAR
jgi:hypothetical protein